MGELLSRTWGLVVLRGVLAVLFGILAVVWPGITVFALVIIWGAYALVDGVTSIAIGIQGRGGSRGLLIFLGVLGVLAGIVAFVWPGITALALLIVIAVWAIATGVLEIAAAWRLRGQGQHAWLIGLTGALSIVLGAILLVRPGKGAVALVVTIGVLAIVWGVVTTLLGLRLRNLAAHEGGGLATPTTGQPA